MKTQQNCNPFEIISLNLLEGILEAGNNAVRARRSIFVFFLKKIHGNGFYKKSKTDY